MTTRKSVPATGPNTAKWISVIDVFHALGFEPEKELTWAVGQAMQRQWEDRMGGLPVKALRPKTNGNGSHCFAVYPPSWRQRIATMVRATASVRTRQSDLFNR